MFRSIMALVALALATFAAPAYAADTPRLTPEAGRHAYRYVVVQQNPGYPDAGYQLDFDLESDGKGGLVAIVIGAFDTDTGKPVPAVVKDSCRTALHAQPGELARITLTPRPAAAVELYDDSFIATCAPTELFFPMLDVMSVVRTQMTPGLDGLRPGGTLKTPALTTHADRDSMTEEVSPGGSIRFVSLTPAIATLDWTSQTKRVTIVTPHGMGDSDSRLSGSEEIAFRLEIDPRTGVLLGARTTHDQAKLLLEVPNGQKIPINITRIVTITPRPGA